MRPSSLPNVRVFDLKGTPIEDQGALVSYLAYEILTQVGLGNLVPNSARITKNGKSEFLLHFATNAPIPFEKKKDLDEGRSDEE